MNSAKSSLVIFGSLVVALSAAVLSPLLSLWVGAQAQNGDLTPTPSGAMAVVGTLAVLTLLHLKALALLGRAHDRLRGHQPRGYRVPWGRGLGDGREGQPPMTAAECAMVAILVFAILAIALWFFTWAHTSLP
jgi:amino acid transporter